MSDYLRKRFPLEATSTVRMSGKSVYSLVRYDVPGIIASIELFPADAEAFRSAVDTALREAARAGYEAARQDMISGAFVSGPTYEALRDSFTGRKIAAEAWIAGRDDGLDDLGATQTAIDYGEIANPYWPKGET